MPVSIFFLYQEIEIDNTANEEFVTQLMKL